jgi:hypothetical protein
MNPNRRDALKSGSLALLGGGLFRRMDKIDGMQTQERADRWRKL